MIKIKFHKIVLSIVLVFISVSCFANDKQAILQLIKRVVPGRAAQFEVQYLQPAAKDVFEIESAGPKIVLRGNNNTSIAVALNYYLRHFCNASISWTGNQLSLPGILPAVKKKVTGEASVDYRFFYNYCTFSYSMAFWDWARWEKEIDWLALHGINLPLAIVGQEAVWQNTLQKIGYTDQEIKAFICGPAFNAWWLMGNLEGWGGPVPQSWIDGQAALQQKIVRRMKALGMQPVLQGFYGMIPNSLIRKYPNAKIHQTGTWLGFQRPAMLLPDDPLFEKMAQVYYEEQAKLYGAADYFQGDPFHEGGIATGVDVTAAAQGIYKAMNDFKPGAVWVLQAWQNNPRPDLLKGIPVGKALVTDLMAEARPQWGGVPASIWHRKEGYLGHHWIWSELPNFGGRTGMTAKLDRTNRDVIAALHHPIGVKTMKGIGATPEAIEQDNVLYDLLFDLAWRKDTLRIQDWLKMYTTSRYGLFDENMQQVWELLRQTVYNIDYISGEDPPFESILCARPGWNKTKTSTWGLGQVLYEPKKLVTAWQLSIQSISRLKGSDAFQYDLVNLTRQVLDNHGRVVYQQMQQAYEARDLTAFEQLSSKYLELMKDVDRLLSSRQEFMLGPWLEMARKRGQTPEEKQWYEWNARTLITTWTHERNDVNDYAYRQWSGLMNNFYYVRWKMFVDYCQGELNGKKPKAPDFFTFEKGWTYQRNSYPVQPQEDAVTIVKALYNKYSPLFQVNVAALSSGAYAQIPVAPSGLKTLGTRSWIRLTWQDNASNEEGYKIYWSTTNTKPSDPGAIVAANKTRFYITGITAQTPYYTWVEAFNKRGSSDLLFATVTTVKNWSLDADEVNNLSIPSSAGVPAGMKLFWHDEFNDELLNRNKWSTHYYSTIDFRDRTNLSAMQNDSLPQPGMIFNGTTINLITNDTIPLKSFWKSGRKVSSIQTYDWNSKENYLDNSRGGYFEVRVKRNSFGGASVVNTAFWFDAPGPGLKYYMEAGNTAYGVTGIRPRGQVFEIDVFENLDAQFVLHGNVSTNGTFEGNLATHIATGGNHINNWVTHGILWSPCGIKHYINGKLVKEYTDKNKIYAPNHFMNVLLGTYGKGGSVNMEVDYIRGYQWPLLNGNELPNPGFEAGDSLMPWEGTATRSASSKRTGSNGVVLAPGQTLEQYVYLNHSNNYQLKYWLRGSGTVAARVENIMAVSGIPQNTYLGSSTATPAFIQQYLDFATSSEYGNHMKTVKITFTNTGRGSISLDDLELVKGGSGGIISTSR